MRSPKTRRQRAASPRSSGHSGSWLALLAAATLGAGAASVVAEVSLDDADRPLRGGAFHRVIVQVYPVASDGVIRRCAPATSEQRIVSVDQLRRGIQVPLLGIEPARAAGASLAVVAWVAPGETHLDVDSFDARPDGCAVMGETRMSAGAESVEVTLQRRRT